jgi:hypothetical protein
VRWGGGGGCEETQLEGVEGGGKGREKVHSPSSWFFSIVVWIMSCHVSDRSDMQKLGSSMSPVPWFTVNYFGVTVVCSPWSG